ncbi:MAG TPA: hypothetical protein VLA46_11320, partial [Saprospiraceae bacterium]|nr:hypothetical protein [Saprospiraceae bacterium]
LGNSTGQSIANGIKSLREAIKAGDGKKYLTNANAVEATFANLSNAEKAAWEAWSSTNLKK